MSERSEASNVSERSEASNVSERSEASSVSERSEVPSVTGDFLWGYFFYLAPPHFFYRGAVDFFTPHIFSSRGF